MPILKTRKLVREQALAMLADAVTGFNEKFAATAPTYGVLPFEIDWSPESTSFLQLFLSPDVIDSSQFLQDTIVPAGVTMYTSTMEQSTDGGVAQKNRRFSGTLVLHIDFYLRFSEGIEAANAEKKAEDMADAVEDAVLQVLHDTEDWMVANLIYNGDYLSDRESLIPRGDGYEQRIPFKFLVEVHV